MFCNLKKLLGLTLCFSVIAIMPVQNLQAQNVTLEPDNMPQLSNDEQGASFLGVEGSIPDELSLPNELPAPMPLLSFSTAVM